ncbi:hypothetical protein LCGC14_0519100 [marine sediment metagenome]|uniref:Uncharacterized protein n=2 Tax=root TaxID=1 RepID=A0A9C9NGL1_9HYPH|nr:hypothetical protein [Aurantimonas coralicida]
MIRLLGSVALVVLVLFLTACNPQSPLRPSGDDSQEVDIDITITANPVGDRGGSGITNQAPRLTAPGDQQNTAGDAVVLSLTVIDPDGDRVTWLAGGLPRTLTIDDTGIISGMISPSSAADSPFASIVAVSDGQLSDSITFTWVVDP